MQRDWWMETTVPMFRTGYRFRPRRGNSLAVTFMRSLINSIESLLLLGANDKTLPETMGYSTEQTS